MRHFSQKLLTRKHSDTWVLILDGNVYILVQTISLFVLTYSKTYPPKIPDLNEGQNPVMARWNKKHNEGGGRPQKKNGLALTVLPFDRLIERVGGMRANSVVLRFDQIKQNEGEKSVPCENGPSGGRTLSRGPWAAGRCGPAAPPASRTAAPWDKWEGRVMCDQSEEEKSVTPFETEKIESSGSDFRIKWADYTRVSLSPCLVNIVS